MLEFKCSIPLILGETIYPASFPHTVSSQHGHDQTLFTLERFLIALEYILNILQMCQRVDSLAHWLEQWCYTSVILVCFQVRKRRNIFSFASSCYCLSSQIFHDQLRSVKLAQEIVVMLTDCFNMPITVDWDVKPNKTLGQILLPNASYPHSLNYFN